MQWHPSVTELIFAHFPAIVLPKELGPGLPKLVIPSITLAQLWET